MVRHIVMWNLREELSPEEQRAAAQKMKALLEELNGLIDALESLTVYIDPLPSANRQVMLSSVIKDEAALKTYLDHPEHKRVGQYVRSVTQDRASMDFWE